MTNAEWMIKNGHKFSDLDAKYLELDRGCEIMLNGKTLERVPIMNMVSAIFYWLDAEHKEPILDEAEKRYLKAVIRPFRNEKLKIVKHSACNGSEEWLNFVSKKGLFDLPNFKTGTMYKGMELNHLYTLEELGL